MKIIDLSGEYTEKMWYYGEPYTPYSVKDLACVDKNGYIAREYTLTAHTGTHIENSAHSVSYTHLTLPTTSRV